MSEATPEPAAAPAVEFKVLAQDEKGKALREWDICLHAGQLSILPCTTPLTARAVRGHSPWPCRLVDYTTECPPDREVLKLRPRHQPNAVLVKFFQENS
jgi:hypothetical protein